MILKLLSGLVLFLLGILAINNYFLIFENFVYFDDKLVMLLNGIALIIAGLIIFIQRILLTFHKNF